MPETEVTEDAIIGFNRPNVMEAGVPGGGGVMTAGDLALFYQGFLHNRGINGEADHQARGAQGRIARALRRLQGSDVRRQG